MSDYFEIAGTHIRLSDIKDFRIIQREYIYRPVYRESSSFGLRELLGKRYEFAGMEPYAAIWDEVSRKSSLESYKAKNFKESVGKDLVEGAIETIGDKFNIKALRAKNISARIRRGENLLFT